jgi:hypothetical protein
LSDKTEFTENQGPSAPHQFQSGKRTVDIACNGSAEGHEWQQATGCVRGADRALDSAQLKRITLRQPIVAGIHIASMLCRGSDRVGRVVTVTVS